MSSIALDETAFTETADDNDPSIELALTEDEKLRIGKSRALANGLPAIRKATTTYLPKLEGESAGRYAVRVELGALHPAHEEMLEGMIGTVLETPITFEKDMPEEGIKLWENIDGRGTGGMAYSRDLLRASMVDAIAGTFVDAPSIDERLDRSKASAAAMPGAPLDAADGAALNLRPYCVQVRNGDFKATYSTINGQEVLTRFTRREVVRQQVGQFGSRKVTQYRVYRRTGDTVTRELWREPVSGEGRPELVPNSLVTLDCDRICWAPLPTGLPLHDGTLKPLLETLGDQVLQYYQVQNGMMSLSFEAFVATIVRMGAVPSKVTQNDDGTVTLEWPELLTGPGEVIEHPIADAKGNKMPEKPIYYLQPASDVLEPADKILERIQSLIDKICAALQGTDVAGESGEAKKQKARGGNARITTLALALKEHWELVYQYLMLFMGKKAGGVNVKTSFKDVMLTAQEIQAITGLVKEGMDVEDAVQVLINRGFFGPHADAAKIAERWRDNQDAAADAAKVEKELQSLATGDPSADPSNKETEE